MNRRQEINKILHTHLDVNKYEDYTNYKALITAIENWHEGEIKKLNLHDVSNNEVAVCKHDWEELENCSMPTIRCRKCQEIRP